VGGLLSEAGIRRLQSEVEEKEPDFSRAERLLRVLANPIRLRMGYLMCWREVCNCEFEGLFGRHQSLISHHIREFKKAGLVHERREGKWRKYSIRDPLLKSLVALLLEGDEGEV
jgi:ArsR family transcriptional regulator